MLGLRRKVKRTRVVFHREEPCKRPAILIANHHRRSEQVSGDYLPMSVTHVDVHASQAVDQSEVYGTYLTNTGTGAKRLAAAVSASS